MTAIFKRIGLPLMRLTLLTLVTLGMLWPPGPYSPLAHAQEEPPATDLFTAYLPTVTNEATAPDLRFEPDNVNLAPGTQTSIQVRVEPAADLRGATFELPGVQDGVVSSFQAADDGMSGTLLITTSTALETGNRALQVQGRSGVTTKTWAGRLALTTTGTANATARFVDALNGSDGNGGTALSPFRSLKKALSVSTTGDIINLAPGLYDTLHSGDTYPLTVPAGVTIIGTLQSTGASASLLSDTSAGTPKTGLIFAGDAKVQDVEIRSFDTGIKADTGVLSLTNTDFTFNRIGLELRGQVQTTLTKSDLILKPETLVTGVGVGQNATFTMVGGKVTGSGADCEGGADAILAFNSAQVTLTGSPRFSEAPGHILGLSHNARATVNFLLATKTYQTGCSLAPLFTASDLAQLTLNDATLTGKGNGLGTAVESNSSALLTISRTSMAGFKRAGVFLFDKAASVKIEQSGIASSGAGIDAENVPNATILVTDTQINANKTGVIGLKIKLRRTKVTNGTTGVIILGNGADLGTAADPGNNTFTGNLQTGVVLREQPFVSTVTLPAVGNTWNKDTQQADANGHYTIPGFSTNSSEIFGLNVSIFKKETTSTLMKVIL